MKFHFHKLIFVILLVLTVISCQNNEDSVPQETITFTVNGDSQKYWIVLSDESGKVLTWKAMANGVQETFTYPSSEKVTLTTIAKTIDMSFTNIKSYAAVKAGDYKIDLNYSYNPGSEGTFLINIDNPAQFGLIVPQSEGSCGASDLYSDPSQMKFKLCDESNDMLIYIIGQTDDIPRYLYQENLSKKGSLTIDKSLFDQLPLMKTKITTFENLILSGYSLTEGRTIKKKQSFYLPPYFTTSNNQTQLKIYYPDLIGKLFSSFTTTIGFMREPNIHNFIIKEAVEPPTSYQELDVSWNFADSVNISTQSISAHANGQADYIFTLFIYYDANNTVRWFVHSPFSNDFDIRPPLFPEDLKIAAQLDLVDKVVRTQINFVEDKGLGGYEGFYKTELNMTTAPRTVPYDRRSKAYKINQSNFSGIYGRKVSTKLPSNLFLDCY